MEINEFDWSGGPAAMGRHLADQAGPIADASTLLERVDALAEAGSQGVFIVLPKIADSDSIERFGARSSPLSASGRLVFVAHRAELPVA